MLALPASSVTGHRGHNLRRGATVTSVPATDTADETLTLADIDAATGKNPDPTGEDRTDPTVLPKRS